jgi:transcriptional regulator with XRE-family HTH domain
MSEFQKQIGEKLRDRRIELGLTMEDVADKADVAVSTVQRLEVGQLNPALATLVAICDALSFPLASVFSGRVTNPRNDLRAAVSKIQQGISELEQAELQPKNELIREFVALLAAMDEPQIRGYLELFRAAARSNGSKRDDLKKKAHRAAQ